MYKQIVFLSCDQMLLSDKKEQTADKYKDMGDSQKQCWF